MKINLLQNDSVLGSERMFHDSISCQLNKLHRSARSSVDWVDRSQPQTLNSLHTYNFKYIQKYAVIERVESFPSAFVNLHAFSYQSNERCLQ